MDDLSPIALFVHSRLEHTIETVKSLILNPQAKKSKLYIFSDSYREGVANEEKSVSLVRDYLESIAGFSVVEIIYRQTNYGLKRNIIEGLNYVLNKHPTVIVLEDDCVTSPTFLNFMNNNLKEYEKINNVWHISGWNPGLNFDDTVFPSYYMSCWGWATWKSRWNELKLDPLELMGSMSISDRYRFNLKGRYPFYSHLLGNYLGVNNTWAIFWYATIYTSGGYCITSPKSLITNIGMDGSGTHAATFFDQNQIEKSSYDSYALEEKLEGTLDDLAAIFSAKQTIRQYIYAQLKMLMPIWALKLIKNMSTRK